MAGIPKEHSELYFDKLCRTQKSETVLSLIQATYHAKRNAKYGEDIRDSIAKRLVSAYELFKDNPVGSSTGAGTYSGEYKQFESQYTIGHELCIWKNSKLDLTDLAMRVAKNEITIRDYFDIFFTNYFQPIDGKAVHILYSILSYIKSLGTNEIEKTDIHEALKVQCSNESVNALCNFLAGTNYFKYNGDKLVYVGKESLSTLISKCNTKYIGTEGLTLARNELSDDEKYVEYITTENVGIIAEDENVDIKQLIKERYEAHTDFDITKENEIYARFNSLYGKDVISSLDGKDLLYRLFAKKEMDKDSLIYNIEHNNDYRRFGGVGGGSSFKYPLFYYSAKNSWIRGTRKTIVELSEEEAILYAQEIRDKLVSLFEAVEKLLPLDSAEKYSQLESVIYSDNLYSRHWVLKYLHMLYPDYFSTFYSSEWLEKVAKKLDIKAQGGNVLLNGQVSLVANELEIPNVFFARVIYELLDLDEENDEIDSDGENESEEEDLFADKELPKRSPRTTKIHPLNAILYGAPGTGKTYATAEYAVAIIENRAIQEEDREKLMDKYRDLQKKGRITFTTFHQSYGYEDFIQGLRPENRDGVMVFKSVDGVFKRIADKALKDNENNYVIIIDEINRANMSKVLGELITLIEEDKRWGEENGLSVTLPSGEPFAVPNNLYILGTMNSADKSISIIDVALRRRFEFIEQQVDLSKVKDATLRGVLKKVNEKLKGETESTDLLVGHAYFMNKTVNDLGNILNRAIIPLLYEYFFDNGKKVKSVVEEAIKDTGYKVDSGALGRIRVVKE